MEIIEMYLICVLNYGLQLFTGSSQCVVLVLTSKTQMRQQNPFFFPQVRWKSKKSDITNGGYTQEMLQSLFEKVANHFIMLLDVD